MPPTTGRLPRRVNASRKVFLITAGLHSQGDAMSRASQPRLLRKSPPMSRPISERESIWLSEAKQRPWLGFLLRRLQCRELSYHVLSFGCKPATSPQLPYYISESLSSDVSLVLAGDGVFIMNEMRLDSVRDCWEDGQNHVVSMLCWMLQ